MTTATSGGMSETLGERSLVLGRCLRRYMTGTHVLDGDRLVGTTVAHYVVNGADSVRVFTTEARRAP
jgi:hypothetical protein